VHDAWPASPMAATLTSLQLRCTAAGHVELPAAWLAGFPRLRRLACGGGVSLDFSDLIEDLRAAEAAAAAAEAEAAAAAAAATAAEAGGGAAAPAGPGDVRTAQEAAAAPAAPLPAPPRARAPPRLPPLEELELDQAELDEGAWAALADGRLLGARLASLTLSRCGPPPRGALRPIPGAVAPPFTALRRLTLGVADPGDALPAVAALTGLADLSLLHLRCGRRGFGPEALPLLAGLTALTRLVMLPVAGGPEAAWGPCPGGGGGGSPAAAPTAAWGPAKGAPGGGGGDQRRLFPLLQEYRGPALPDPATAPGAGSAPL
jgi:hypothetical protein